MERILDSLGNLPRKTFAAGEIIVEEGQPKGDVLILEQGEVEILKQDIQINTVDLPGSIFGEISVLLDRPHTATVKALRPCSFYLVENGLEFFMARPEVHLHLTKLLARRLNGVTNYLVDLKNQFKEQEDHLGMVDDVLESLLHQQSEND